MTSEGLGGDMVTLKTCLLKNICSGEESIKCAQTWSEDPHQHELKFSSTFLSLWYQVWKCQADLYSTQVCLPIILVQGHCCLTCLHLCNSPVLHLVLPVSTGVMAQFSQLFDLSLSELWSSSPSYVACLYLSNGPVLPAMWPVCICLMVQFS